MTVVSDGAVTGDPPPVPTGGMFRAEALAARGVRRPSAPLDVAGLGQRVAVWGIVALTAAGAVAAATIRIPRTVVGRRVPGPGDSVASSSAGDKTLQCRVDRGEVGYEFSPALAALVPRWGAVKRVTSKGAQMIAVHTPPGAAPTERCLRLAYGAEATVEIAVPGGTGFEFVFGRQR